MEGSSNSRNVENYYLLSKYYDSLLQDEDSLSLWLEYIEEKPFKTVLELASGSGVMAGILKNKGYEIIASDLSEEMKNVSVDNYDGEYRIINMISFDLQKTFDLVLCICDSINYLSTEELDSCFESAYKHLNEGGRFIFDMHSPERLEEFREVYIEEGQVEDVDYQWMISADEYNSTVNEHFAFYTADGVIQENHTQFVHDKNVVIKKMQDAGFKVRLIEDFVPEEKMLVIGEK